MRAAHQDQGGQTIIFVVLVLFTMICFFALVINVGHRVNTKVEMQNASDASVMSGAVWNARGLNMISILNVGMTECLALIILFKAFDSTFKYAQIVHKVNTAVAAALCACPFTAAFGCPWQSCLSVMGTLLNTVYKPVNTGMQKTIDPLWKLMKTLRTMEKVVQWAAPAMAQYEASRIARLNGADCFLDVEIAGKNISYCCILLPFDLPVDDGVFKDLCPPTKDGGPGYDNFLCWDSALDMKIPPHNGIQIKGALRISWVALVCIIPPPIAFFDLFVKLQTNALCGGDSSEEIEHVTKRCDECKDNNGTAEWRGGEWCEIKTKDCDSEIIGDCKNPSKRTGCKIYPESGCSVIEPTKENDACKLCKLKTEIEWEDCDCDVAKPDAGCVCGNKLDTHYEKKPVKHYYKKIWILRECKYMSEVNAGTGPGKKPAPLVLADEWEKKANYTAIVYKTTKDRLSFGPYKQGGESHVFGTPDTKTVGIAQAKIYNPTGADLFNQDWHVRLKPCKIEDLNLSIGGVDIMDYVPEGVRGLADKAAGEIIVH